MKGTRLWNERRAAMVAACGGRCWYCGTTVTLAVEEARTARFATIDHQHPRDQGGDDSEENLVVACFSCNSRKGASTVEEYRAYLWRCDPHIRLAAAIDEALASGVHPLAEILEARLQLITLAPAVVFAGEKR